MDALVAMGTVVQLNAGRGDGCWNRCPWEVSRCRGRGGGERRLRAIISVVVVVVVGGVLVLLLDAPLEMAATPPLVSKGESLPLRPKSICLNVLPIHNSH